jgi:hypothetical protein
MEGLGLHIEYSFVTSLSTPNRASDALYQIGTNRSKDTSVDIATRYGLDGPGIESRRARDFPHLSRLALGPTMGKGSFRGVKWLGRGVDHPHLAPRLMKE